MSPLKQKLSPDDGLKKPTGSAQLSGGLRREKTEPAPPEPKTYVIQTGDTLGKIAKAMYGDASRWQEIYQANKDVIANPDVIQVGVELKIP